MAIIFCDSACDLWKNQIEEWGVKRIDFPYSINGEEQEHQLESPEDFDNYYIKLKGGAMPSTASINMYMFREAFEPYLKQGEDILYIHLSSALTGTFNYLPQVIEELEMDYPDRKILTVDSLHVTMGIGLLVYRATRMLKAGKSLEDIKAELDVLKNKIACYFAVDDLFFLKRGSRISTMQAVGGTLLGVKPILKCNEAGKIVKVTNVKGRKNVIAKLVSYLEEYGENVGDFPIVIMHANKEQDALELKEEIVKIVGNESNVWIQPVGPIIGCHCGPGTLAIVFRSRVK